MDVNGSKGTETCGCAITGEEKRKTLSDGSQKVYRYWHCSNTTKSCSQRNRELVNANGGKLNYSDEDIEKLFAEVFKPFKWENDMVSWMQDYLRTQHAEESRRHAGELGGLQRRYTMLERYIDSAYEDKLNGVIDENRWRVKNDSWLKEQSEIKQRIDLIGQNKQD